MMNEIGNRFIAQVSSLQHPCTLDDHMIRQLHIFYQNLIEWNKVMNLTTITEEKDVYEKHFLDSISILNVLSSEELSGKKMIDVGTGAGFPGLVLAIVFPDLKITLMDSLNKRISFLQDTIAKLSLHNVITIHARAEELARDKKHREQYDFVVSRAVANLSTLCEYDLPFCKVGGYFIAYKSEKAQEEVNAAQKAIPLLGGKIEGLHKFTLPETDYERCLVEIQKTSATPKKYPRKAGTPSKEPL